VNTEKDEHDEAVNTLLDGAVASLCSAITVGPMLNPEPYVRQAVAKILAGAMLLLSDEFSQPDTEGVIGGDMP